MNFDCMFAFLPLHAQISTKLWQHSFKLHQFYVPNKTLTNEVIYFIYDTHLLDVINSYGSIKEFKNTYQTLVSATNILDMHLL